MCKDIYKGPVFTDKEQKLKQTDSEYSVYQQALGFGVPESELVETAEPRPAQVCKHQNPKQNMTGLWADPINS